MPDKTVLQQQLEEQFQELLPNSDAPVEIKEKVFDTLESLDSDENDSSAKTTTTDLS